MDNAPADCSPILACIACAPSGMPNPTPLQIVEGYIRAASLQIDRLRMLIGELERAGEDTSSAEELMMSMHELLVDWHVVRAKLLAAEEK